jgi:hypothetical protein
VSWSPLRCPTCKKTVARKHHGGRLHVCKGVDVFYDPNGQHGPFLGLRCVCGKVREYRIARPTIDE